MSTGGSIPFSLTWQKGLCAPGLALSRSSRLVGHALATYMDANGLCWPTIEQLCIATAYSKSTVYEALSELEHFLFIRRQPGRTGRATTYQATLP